MDLWIVAPPGKPRDDLAAALAPYGYRLACVEHAADMLIALERDPRLGTPLVIVLALPSLEEIEASLRGIRRDARARDARVFVCAPVEQSDSVRLLAAGADDCYGHSFVADVFAARVRGLARSALESRRESAERFRLTVGALAIDILERRASLDGRPLELSRMEFDLLRYIAQSAGKEISRQDLASVVAYKAQPAPGIEDVIVENLRSKLGALGDALVWTAGALRVDLPR